MNLTTKSSYCFQKGSTALHIACSLGCKGILELLIQHNALLNKQNKVRQRKITIIQFKGTNRCRWRRPKF